MITTITTVTTAIAAQFPSATFAIMGAAALLLLLVNREITASSAGERARRLSKVLTIAIVPLLIGFLISMGLRLAGVLN